jgi:hypothetical protein
VFKEIPLSSNDEFPLERGILDLMTLVDDLNHPMN